MEELFCSMQLTVVSSQSGQRTFPIGVICKSTLNNLCLFTGQKEKVNAKNFKDNIHVFCHRRFHSSQKTLVLYCFF